jgi:hypothetical protein
MQCPYEYPELRGTEYKTRAELYDLQNPQPATKEFLVKLLRFHICCHPTVCGMICLAMALRVEVGDGRLGAVPAESYPRSCALLVISRDGTEG